MSVEKIASVLHHAPIGGTAKLLLIGIANHEGDGGAWPAIATLARYAGVNERNARKMVQRLVDLGLVETIMREGRTTLYRTMVECPANCDRSTNHRLTPVAGDTPVFTDPPVAGDPPTPVAGDRGTPVASDPRTVIEPSDEPTLNTHFKNEIFEEFISLYPRKSDRGNAWASFAKLSDAGAIAAVATLHDWLGSEEYPEPKYWPYAANWLDRGYHLQAYTPKTTETTVAERAKEIRKRNTETPVDNVAEMIECEHGKTGYCAICYHNTLKGHN